MQSAEVCFLVLVQVHYMRQSSTPTQYLQPNYRPDARIQNELHVKRHLKITTDSRLVFVHGKCYRNRGLRLDPKT